MSIPISQFIQLLFLTQLVKNPRTMQETPVWFLGWEDPLEERTATHSCILVWRIPWTEEPGRLQSTGWQKVRLDWATFTFTISYSLGIHKFVLYICVSISEQSLIPRFFFNVYFSCFLLAFLWFFPLYFYHLELILAYGDYFSDASLLIPTFIEWPTLIDFLNGLPYFQGCFFFCIWLRNNLLKLKWRK